MSLKGVQSVQQGWIKPATDDFFSEGVTVTFDEDIISFEVLIAIHLYTHSATANHSMRDKYRSAIYTFNDADSVDAAAAMTALQHEFDAPLITQVLPYSDFRLNREDSLNYYFSDPSRPFCENYINPKLKLLLAKFGNAMDNEKLQHLKKG